MQAHALKFQKLFCNGYKQEFQCSVHPDPDQHEVILIGVEESGSRTVIRVPDSRVFLIHLLWYKRATSRNEL